MTKVGIESCKAISTAEKNAYQGRPALDPGVDVSAHGGALALSEGNATLTTVNLSQCSASSNDGTAYGSQLFVDTSYASLSNSTISFCDTNGGSTAGDYDGAIALAGASRATISSTALTACGSTTTIGDVATV